MKSVLDAIPDVIMPDAAREADSSSIPLEHPDDYDLLRPLAEDELPSAGRMGSLTGADTTPLSRHLIWTFGPVHRAMPFPLQLRFEISGDRILATDAEIGWLHQGLERSLAEVTSLQEGFSRISRLYPRTPLFGILLWARAWEEAYGLSDDVPPRVQWLRTAGLEMSRVVAHLRVLMVLSEVYADRLSQQIFTHAYTRSAECLANLQFNDVNVENVSAEALPEPHNIFSKVGGMECAPDLKSMQKLEETFSAALEYVAGMRDQQLRNVAFVDGLRGRGVVSIRTLIDSGVTGPALRACGVKDDIRLRQPNFAYEKCPPKSISQQAGDALARASQLLEEVADSVRMVRYSLQEAQKADPSLGSVLNDAPDKVGNHVVTSIESSAGELCMSLYFEENDLDQGLGLQRVRLKTPSFSLATALPHFLYNANLDDVVPVMLGLGIIGSALDR
ncbi:MAG: hypothetical protein GY822_26695 [Deltaproteobacteria bacterium]|nr:hypothetical protein [Deltaproteobacteria bacterium]